MQKVSSTYILKTEEDIKNIQELPKNGDIWFFFGDLGYGKTTLIRHLLRNYFGDLSIQVRSPTYTYYTKYDHIYHFDLYRVDDYDGFISIGGDEILQNPENISLIEWPEILEWHINPTHRVTIEIWVDGTRTIGIERYEND